MIFVTAISMSPPDSQQHEHITRVYWENTADGESGWMSKQQAVDWLNGSSSNRLWVRGQPKNAEVVVVSGTPDYLRTVADGYYTNNLLSLPRR